MSSADSGEMERLFTYIYGEFDPRFSLAVEEPEYGTGDEPVIVLYKNGDPYYPPMTKGDLAFAYAIFEINKEKSDE